MNRLTFRMQTLTVNPNKQSPLENPEGGEEPSDPQRVDYYAEEIHENLLEEEEGKLINADYIQSQPHINHKMRAILVDWLVSSHQKFKLLAETLHLSVHIVDRYLQKVAIQKKHLQLVGIASMLISTKYEEIYPPSCKDFLALTDHAYTKEQLIRMEVDVLNVLNFDMTVPSSLTFLQRYARLLMTGEVENTLALYLTELALVEYHMLKFKPSVIAAAALYVSLKLQKNNELWRNVNQEYETVRLCAKEILLLFQCAPSHPLTAVRDKFAEQKFFCVSTLKL